MNKIVFSIFVAVTVIFMTACEDSRVNYMVASKIGLVNPGYSELNVYKGMDVTSYQVYVIKSGNGGQSANVSVSVDDAVLDKYNTENETSFLLLPSGCYAFVQEEIGFGGSDYRKSFEIEWKKDQLALLEAGSYALPVKMGADHSELVATDRTDALIVLHVKDACLEMESPGFYDTPLEPLIGDLGDTEISLKVYLPFVNKSGLTYQLTVDSQLLDDYNTINGTNYQLLPEDAYSLASEWNVPAGESEGIFNLIYKGTGLNPDENTYLLGDYVLPIRIASVSTEDGNVIVSPDAGYILYPVIFQLSYLKLKTTWEVIDHNNSYFDEIGGGWYELRGPHLMIDNDPSTFWMSTWTAGAGSGLPYYITFDMKQEFALYKMGLTVPSGGNEWRAYQKEGYLEISQDNENWNKLTDWTAKEGASFETQITSPQKGRYVKLWITSSYSSASRAAIGEFDAWGQ